MTEPMKHTILVVEDDAALRALLRGFLELMHYRVLEAGDLHAFRTIEHRQPVDLILLDLNLPDGDGLDLLRELAVSRQVPVFVVSGRCDEQTRLQALEAGADDYINKPFNARELEFRIRNFLRRQRSRIGANTAVETGLAMGDWRLLPDQYRITGPNGELVNVTRSERDLLQALIRAGGNLCNRRQLARAMSSPSETTSEETVTVLIYRLRKKMESAGAGNDVIETVAGAGYRLSSGARRETC
mgnify:CR=1 FL=1